MFTCVKMLKHNNARSTLGFFVLSPVSRETVTTFSVVFMHKLLYNVEKITA